MATTWFAMVYLNALEHHSINLAFDCTLQPASLWFWPIMYAFQQDTSGQFSCLKYSLFLISNQSSFSLNLVATQNLSSPQYYLAQHILSSEQ